MNQTDPHLETPPAPAPGTHGKAGGVRALLYGRRPRATLIRIVLLVATTFALFNWVLLAVRVTGISMEPTFRDRSIRIVNRLAYRRSEPQRGDIVSVGVLGQPGMLMKRIIALPGETCSMQEGQVFVNGKPLDEPYVVYRAPWYMSPETLGPDEYLVIGDNRGMPRSEHYHGSTQRRFIVGKVLY